MFGNISKWVAFARKVSKTQCIPVDSFGSTVARIKYWYSIGTHNLLLGLLQPPDAESKKPHWLEGRNTPLHTVSIEQITMFSIIKSCSASSFIKELACQPGVARAFALRAVLRRFAPLAGSAQLSRFAITQARDELSERLLFHCSSGVARALIPASRDL